jgi:hypothetical protein
MSAEFWAIIGVGIAVVMINLIAASENEKRLELIIRLLEAGLDRPLKRDDLE